MNMNIYMQEERRNIYIALEELNFIWNEDDVKEFDYLWRNGWGLEYIANYFKRDPDEVAILVMCRARKGKIRGQRRLKRA